MKFNQKLSPRKAVAASAVLKKSGKIGKMHQEKASSLKSEHPLILAFTSWFLIPLRANALLTAFLGTVDQTSDEIQTRVDLTLKSVLDGFQTRLNSIQQRCLDSRESIEAKDDMITQPLGETSLEWESVDKVHFGKTTLKSRVKKLEKSVAVEEVSIGREMELLRQVNLELHRTMIEVIGKDKYEEIIQSDLDASLWDPQRQLLSKAPGVRLELKSEESKWLHAIESTNHDAMNRTVESEKVNPNPI